APPKRPSANWLDPIGKSTARSTSSTPGATVSTSAKTGMPAWRALRAAQAAASGSPGSTWGARPRDLKPPPHGPAARAERLEDRFGDAVVPDARQERRAQPEPRAGEERRRALAAGEALIALHPDLARE